MIKKLHFVFLGLAAVLSIMTVCLYPRESVAGMCEQWIGKAVSVQGSVQARRSGEKQWNPVRFNDTFCPGDMIRVQELSRAEIILSNDTTLRLDQKTTVTFSKPKKETTFLIDLIAGAVHFFSRVPRSLELVTPSVNAAVKGTEFFVMVEDDQTFLSVFEGQVDVMNDAGSVTLKRGDSAMARKGQAPALRLVVHPRDAVQWALYYPPVIWYRAGELPAGPETDLQVKMRKSIEFYEAGNSQDAFASLGEIPEDVRDPRFFIYRASLLLSVGRVAEAEADIGKTLRLAPADSHALALQSIIALVQNDKDKALDFARAAVEADPQSVSARIALSYAQQANFDLKGALASLKDAVGLDPGNALAWARLADLQMSLGELDKALESAGKAAALSPTLALTQTVLGYAYLAQIRTKMSKEAFGKAIELDQADPLPRLGLGLAKIREGDLADGRTEIEIAASLDPNESIIRSYLGKSFYEEKREQQASNQYTTAKELDPLDPTPFFYDAILKQSINRPVEALHDLQKSLELNDNRAVYRSRLLLDSDLAARSASQARIYSDLGFQQLALVEASKSVNTDPSNFSAHRFLSDTYAALPRHEIARVSELLQSQLLQPINITPVQPILAEADLFILRSSGPSDPGFREFNPLFNRNRLTLDMSGVAGSNSTLGEEILFSGVYNRLSFSAGQFHYETNGFRTNNDQQQNLYDLFAQYSFTEKTSIQAEFRYRNTENGDLTLNFFPDDFLPNYRKKEDDRSFRLGFHHSFSPGSDLIGSFIYQNTDIAEHNVFFPVGTPTNVLDTTTNQNSYSGELQHIFRRDRFSLVSGAGLYRTDINDDSETEILLPPPLPPTNISQLQERDIRHANLYLYSEINYPENVVLTVGASGDFFNGDLIDRDQFNPKLGLTWNPSSSTTLRAALFRTLKRTLVTNQTLEPTQVAGFNQFFDDANGTEAWVFGAAVDQKFSQNVYGGIEYYQRDMKVPAQITFQPPPPAPPSVTVEQVDWKEYEGRAYLYWTPHPWFALSAEYLYEQLNRDPQFVAGIERVKTHRLPLGVSFFHPSGIGAALKATYINQNGMFQPQGVFAPPGAAPTFIPGADSFWVVDASIDYRLPNRWGIVSVVGKNLFGKSFSFQDTDPVSPAIQPVRSVYFKFTVAL